MVHIWGGMALFPPLATPMQAEDPAHMAGVSFSVDLWHRDAFLLLFRHQRSKSSSNTSLPCIEPPPKVHRSPSSVQNCKEARKRPQRTGPLLPLTSDGPLTSAIVSPPFREVNKLSAKPGTESKHRDILRYFDPVAAAALDSSSSSLRTPSALNPFQPGTGNPTPESGLNSSASHPTKLFEFDPANYERQRRYEPLQKVQSARWHDAPVAKQPSSYKAKKTVGDVALTSSKALVLPENNDEGDVTVGSLLDEIDSQFMTEFWEGDTAETMRTPQLPSGERDVSSSGDEQDDKFVVEKKLVQRVLSSNKTAVTSVTDSDLWSGSALAHSGTNTVPCTQRPGAPISPLASSVTGTESEGRFAQASGASPPFLTPALTPSASSPLPTSSSDPISLSSVESGASFGRTDTKTVQKHGVSPLSENSSVSR